jgi:choline-sulfatase
MTDEQRADCAGFSGNQVIRTPNLDQLAQDAVVFDHAYTPSPICIPGRQCMMSGKLPKNCGCLRYGDDLPPFSMTFSRRFSQYAYMTIACGKLHHLGIDQNQGWLSHWGVEGSDVAGVKSIDGLVMDEFKKIGMQRQKWDDVKEIKRAGIGPSPYVQKDDFAALAAIHAVQQHFLSAAYDRAQPERPILLKLSLNQPHYPYLTPDARKFEYYLNRVPLFTGQNPFPHPWLGKSPNQPGAITIDRDISLREMQRATAAYYAMIETADEMFGKVLAEITHAGQDLDDWIIIFTSDHGEMLGEHSIWEKQKFFEGSVRVPLFIRYPKRFSGRRIDQNVNLVDLFATLCDLAEIPTPEGLDSRSLVGLMNGNTSDWKNETLSHFGVDFLMIKQDNLKYQYYGSSMPEVLFDLDRDPGETHNFAEDPEYQGKMIAFRLRKDQLNY